MLISAYYKVKSSMDMLIVGFNMMIKNLATQWMANSSFLAKNWICTSAPFAYLNYFKKHLTDSLTFSSFWNNIFLLFSQYIHNNKRNQTRDDTFWGFTIRGPERFTNRLEKIKDFYVFLKGYSRPVFLENSLFFKHLTVNNFWNKSCQWLDSNPVL